MALRDIIQKDLTTAMKAGDEVTKQTLRMLKAEILNKEVALGRPLEADEDLGVLTSAVKTRRDSIAEYDKAGRADLAEHERAQIAVVERYLPAQLDEAAAKKAIGDLAGELGVSTKKEMGKLMKAVMERYKGQIDGKLASKLAGELLS
jgi:uncharacterized protein YqeY